MDSPTRIYLDYTTIKASKRHDLSNPITAAFKAIEQAAHSANIEISSEAEVVFVFGSITDRKPDTERAISIQKHRDEGKKILSLDSALFSTYIRRTLNSPETYMFRVGLGDCTGEGNFLNENSGPERFEWFKNVFKFTEGEPRIDNTAPIFFALQSEKGWTYNDSKPFYESARDIIQRIRERTDRTIVLKPHPNTDRHPIEWITRGFSNIETLRADRTRRDLLDDISGCGAFVTHSSSAACESYVSGIPTFALDKRCVVYNQCENNLDKINQLETIDWKNRQQNLYNMSMTSWHIREMSNPQWLLYYLNKL